jgi:hypothetical protein
MRITTASKFRKRIVIAGSASLHLKSKIALNPLSGAGFPEFSQPLNKLNRRSEISIQRKIVRNSAPITAFGAQYAAAPAPKTGTRLWTPCTRLKINDLKSPTFY